MAQCLLVRSDFDPANLIAKSITDDSKKNDDLFLLEITSFLGNITRAHTLATVTLQLHLPNFGTRSFKNSAMWSSVEKVWRTLGAINLFVTSCHHNMIF